MAAGFQADKCSDPHLFLIPDATCIAETIGSELPISYARTCCANTMEATRTFM